MASKTKTGKKPVGRDRVVFDVLSVAVLTVLSLFCLLPFWLVISGITSTGIIPGCINVYNNQVDDSDAFLATGITESGVNIGAFLTTPFIAVIESTGGTAVQSLLYTPVALVIMAFITAWCCKRAGTKQ